MSETIAVDFDGVLHAHTSAWTDVHEIHDGPVDGAIEFLRATIDAGIRVVIFTARAKTATSVPHIYAWLRVHGLEEKYTWQIEITCLKPAALVYLDDRGWRFDGVFPSPELIRAFRVWNKP